MEVSTEFSTFAKRIEQRYEGKFDFMAKENGHKVSIDIVKENIFAVVMMVVTAIALLRSTASFASCTANDDNAASQYEQATFIPQAPDYNDAAMWVTADGDNDDTGADIFYVVSTWEEDWTTEDGRICHYADVWNPMHRERMYDLEIKKVAAYMSSGNQFFAPFYRHTTMEA